MLHLDENIERQRISDNIEISFTDNVGKKHRTEISFKPVNWGKVSQYVQNDIDFTWEINKGYVAAR